MERRANETASHAPDPARAHGRIPRATYRLQLGPSFSFRDAERIVPYLDALGISDCYCSPILRSRPGSPHGYDICDHGAINEELGGREAFDALAESLRSREMGLLLDIVPNHMSVAGGSNRWWNDVLENGPDSPFSGFFDIDWEPFKPELRGKLLLPILDEQYGTVLEGGKIRLAHEDGAFFLLHQETPLPLALRSYVRVLEPWSEAIARASGENSERAREGKSILTAAREFAERSSHEPVNRPDGLPARTAEREREKDEIRRRISSLLARDERAAAALEDTIRALNGIQGDPLSFDVLDSLIEEQAYRPAFWKVAGEEINYRRFFDINDLAAIRVELPDVFEATHRTILPLLAEGKITGLRVDHADGLLDPAGYLRQLQERFLKLIPPGDGDGLPSNRPALYLLVEKILSGDEKLREDWPVHGTTGYDFLNDVNGLFVDRERERVFTRLYARFASVRSDFDEVSRGARRMIMAVALAGEIHSLGHALDAIAERNRYFRDFTLDGLTAAIRETIAALNVYRTYIDSRTGVVSAEDRSVVESAIERADEQNPRTARSLFEFVRDTLLLRNLAFFREDDRRRLTAFVMKFQQVTGPVMAKGVEDTAFYAYNRLVSLNEVGGAPDRFGTGPARFHERNAERARRWPHTMLATATHDTKRGEDVRVRIDVLSEMPKEWEGAVKRWSKMNAPHKTIVEGRPAPGANDEYLFYQTAVGAWPEEMRGSEREALPALRERMAAYMLKATKEAKLRTSWINANEEYDHAVQNFVRGALADAKPNAFLDDLQKFQKRIAHFGRLNGLSQTVLKIASPGVPDFYQGCELWDLSLVDPDNRRPVDYDRRAQTLSSLIERAEEDAGALAAELLETAEDGRVKLFVIHRGLSLRREHRELFADGAYRPLHVRGRRGSHAVAFARLLEGRSVIAVVPRLVAGLMKKSEKPPLGKGVWGDTRIALPREMRGAIYRNAFTGERHEASEDPDGGGLRLAEILARFPVALLEGAAPVSGP